MHSWISPSKIAVAQYCSGSLQLQRNIEELPETEYQLDGTAAHNYSANLLGKPIPFDHYRVTPDMVDDCQMYVDYVKSIAGDNAVIEERVNIPRIHFDCFGYPDAYFYDHTSDTVHIFDLKYGWRLIEAYKNWQLICYGAGVNPNARRYVLHIIQPRPYHPEGPIRTHELTNAEFRAECVKIVQAVQLAINNPTLTTGPHCRKCDALLHCNSRWEAILNGIEVVSQLEQTEVTPDRIASQFLILDHVQDMINKQKDKAEQVAEYLFSQGKNLPGLTQEQGRGSIKWEADAYVIIKSGDVCGFDLRKKDALMTPLQAIKAGAPEALINALSKSYSGKRKVKPIDLNKASRIFRS